MPPADFFDSTPKNTEPCGGPENIHDGCGMIFERWPPGSTLCSMCKKLKNTDITREEALNLQDTLTQCESCGLCGTNIRNPCGTCLRKEATEASLSPPNAEAAMNRRNRMEGRLGKNAAAVNVSATTPEAELNALRSNTGKVGHFSVLYECRRSNAPGSVDKVLGKGCAPYSEKLTMLQLQERIVNEVNPRWTDKHTSDLQLNETELRARGNVAFPPDVLGLTLREWYNRYNRSETREVFLSFPTGMGKITKGAAFLLELFIHVDQYLERTGEEQCISGMFGSEISNRQKRKAVKAMNSANSKVKCNKAGGTVLQSRFLSTTELADLPDVRTANYIYFKRTTCTVHPDTGKPSLVETASYEPGLLDDDKIELTSATHGCTKEIYGLVINNQQFVAKKLVNIGQGPVVGGIEPTIASKYLTADLIRLTRMSTFAKLFFEKASAQGAEVADFHVSEGFLIKLYRAATTTATLNADLNEAASRSTDSDTVKNSELHCDSEILTAVYLVEPRRASTAVHKYSGTLGVSSRIDKKSATMMAFSHFVLESTACTYMFADIQGSIELTLMKKSTITLFDPMTHSPKGYAITELKSILLTDWTTGNLV
ncbi:hypothetical protein JOM56_004467 [Amanita muscaria]